MCVIEGCERKPVAKRLCAKHYMRQRRAGDATSVRRAGRKRSELREAIDEAMPKDWSPRTKQRFAEAIKMLQKVCSDEEVHELVNAATRPNGGLNVSKLKYIALMNWVVRAPESVAFMTRMMEQEQ